MANKKKKGRDEAYIMLLSLHEYMKILMADVIFPNYLEKKT
jgi:hypothetical protein